jgi:predicted transcriptional regulator
MNAREILSHIEILRALQGNLVSISSAAAICSVSRPTVRRFIHDCEDCDLVRRSSDDYTLTAAGDVLLREYDDIDDEKQAGLASLIKSEKRVDVLRAIENHPPDKAELAEKSDTSRPTVHRLFDNYPEWINEQSEYIGLSSDGSEIMEIYDILRGKINIIEANTEFLKRLEDVDELPPIEALAESRMVTSTITDRREVVREIIELEVDDLESVRGISHVFSQEISEQFESKIPLDTECELIVDRSVYAAITNPKRWKYLFRSLRRPNFRLLVLPKDVTVGIGLFADEQAVVAAYNAEHPFHAALIGENEEFIEWAEKTYERYQTQANPPTIDLVKWAMNA